MYLKSSSLPLLESTILSTSGRRMEIAYVEFTRGTDMDRIVDSNNGKELHGNVLEIKIAERPRKNFKRNFNRGGGYNQNNDRRYRDDHRSHRRQFSPPRRGGYRDNDDYRGGRGSGHRRRSPSPYNRRCRSRSYERKSPEYSRRQSRERYSSPESP